MAITSSHVLEAHHVSKQVNSGDTIITILRDVNLLIKEGESVAILGASGSGKTTLLTLLAGLDLPSTGEIFFRESKLNELSEEARALIRGKNIGFIFQSFQLLPSLTAIENVMLPLEIQSLSTRDCFERASQQLHQVGLAARLNHYPSQLSGGEQQRVAIARAFVTNPSVIFADEMTGNLDTETGKKIITLIFSLNKESKTTLILVTHDQQLSKQCHRSFYLQDGVLTSC